jgi:hypothetical protein
MIGDLIVLKIFEVLLESSAQKVVTVRESSEKVGAFLTEVMTSEILAARKLRGKIRHSAVFLVPDKAVIELVPPCWQPRLEILTVAF